MAKISLPTNSIVVSDVKVRDVQKKEGANYVPTGEREIVLYHHVDGWQGKEQVSKKEKLTSLKMSSIAGLDGKSDDEIIGLIKGSIVSVDSTLEIFRLKSA